MMPSGARTPHGGTQPVVPSSLMRTNSGVLGSTGHAAGSLPGQQPFSSLVSPCIEFGSNSGGMGLLGNMSNVASLVTPLGNVMPGSSGAGFPSPSSSLQQRGGGADMMGGIEPDPLAFSSVHGTAQGQHFANGHTGNLATEKPQGQLLDGMQGFQQQFAMPQHSQPQTQLREGMGNAGGVGAVKLEPLMGHGVVGPVKLESQMSHLDQNGPAQQLQALRTMSSVKMETQQLEPARTLGPVKLERQQLDSSMFFQQQQQQQLLMSRQSPQVTAAQMSPLQQQQRMLQLQQQQHHQQQILKTLSPQQRNQLQQQVQQCIPPRPQAKPVLYEPGTCARRLTYYMYHQQHRPEDNNIEFWRRFVSEFFAPNAKKRWCVSLYGSGRQTTGVFPQDAWHCEICNRKPGRGFETTFEVLPRLFQIKYASGTLEELLYVDMPREYKNASGHIVLDYAKAVQESVFEQLRVVREGQLRIVFSSDFKICSWEFCARQHEELIPRRLLIPQVSQLGAVMQKCQNATQHATSGLSSQDLQNTCSSFASSARQLAKSLEVPLVNDLGYTKRYVRCLQISEVVNSMKDLIDYSRETGTGPMDSLIKFPQKGAASSSLQCQQARRSEDQQTAAQSIVHNDQGASVAAGFQLTSVNNSVIRANNSVSNMPSSCTTTSTGLLHQNSMNSRQENQMSSVSSPYCGGNTAQIPSASSSNSIPPSQPNPSSPFPSPTLSTSNNTAATSHTAANLNSTSSPVNMPMMQQPSTEAQEADPSEPQSSVQQILKEMMMSSQLNTTMGNDMKCINGMAPTLNGVNCLVGNMTANGDPVNGMGYGRIGASGIGGLRAAMANSAMSMNGQVGMSHISRDPTGMNHPHHLQQEMANRLLSRLGPGNGFSNLQFDWKSP